MTNRNQKGLLRKARLSKNWTQDELAERLGVTTVTVGRWERGDFIPTRQNIAELSQLFGMTPKKLGFFSDGVPQERSPKNAFIADPMIPLPLLHPLFGREDIVDTIQSRLTTDPTIIALHGLPGVGKTALLVSLLSKPEVRAAFPDGLLWASLGPKPNIPEILSRWATLLGIAVNGIGVSKSSDAITRILCDVIGSRRFLIILDDLWDEHHTLELNVGGPSCSYIATTRSPHVAASFALHEAIHVPELSEERGIALLEYLAPLMRTQDAQQVRTLVRSVGALPLALTLAGRYLHVQGYHGQSRRLQTAMDHLLDAKEHFYLSQSLGVHPKHSSQASLSLQSVIAMSDRYLDEQAQGTLRALSIFPAKPNTFSEEAALAVSMTPLETLDRLSDVGLLEIDARGRYTLHQTIIDYAHSHSSSEDADARFIAYYAGYMQRYAMDYEEIERDSVNLRTMLDRAHHRGMYTHLVQGTCTFVPFLLLRGLYDLAEYYLQHAYEWVQSKSEDEITLLLLLGQTAQKQGHYAQAVEYFQQGLLLARRQERPEWISAFLSDLGWVTWKQGHYLVAEEHLREGLTLARQIKNEERLCKILRVLGAVLSSLGNYSQANKHLREGLALAREISHREHICVLLIDLGVSSAENNRLLLADRYLREGLALAQQIGHREWMSLASFNLAELAVVLSRYEEAEEYAREGLILARQINSREWTCGSLINLGIALREQGAFSQARVSFREALSLTEELGRPYLTFMGFYEYACLTLEQKDAQTTEALLKAAHDAMPEKDPETTGLYLFGMSRLAALQGNISDAVVFGEESKRTITRSDWMQKVEQWLSGLYHTYPIENTLDAQALS